MSSKALKAAAVALWAALASAAVVTAVALLTSPASAQLFTLSFAGEPVPLARVEVHEGVDQELLLLSEAKARVWLTLRRSTRHLPVIEGALAAAKVPPDFKYLPMALTNLDPEYRFGGRRGLWRLSESEAAGAGLVVNKDLDERMDPVSSSQAAAAKLAGLRQSLGSWSLALAAFLDQAGLSAALAEGEGERDPYKLYLPEDLDRAIFQVLAGKILYLNPERYGYRQPKGWPAISPSRVRLEAPMAVKSLAAHYRQDYKTFRGLNPQLLTAVAPAGAWLNIP
jgi:hypothetical protein